MAKVLSLSQALKAGLFFIFALLALAFGDRLGEHLMADPNHSIVRWAGVGVVTACVVPWICTIVWGVAVGDEYVRQVALVGTAIGFVLDVLLHVGFIAAQDARLVSWSAHVPTLPAAIGAWLLGVLFAGLYYRYRP